MTMAIALYKRKDRFFDSGESVKVAGAIPLAGIITYSVIAIRAKMSLI
jgi:hypothetical protein